MNWRWILLGMLVGGLGAAWWFLLQWHQENKNREVPQQGQGSIALMVQHDGPELQLHWSTQNADIQNASGGTLTIDDGSHQSKLDLDESELRSGVADFWPQSDHVTFDLQTDNGAWGTLTAPAWDQQPPEPIQQPNHHEPAHAAAHHPASAKSRHLAESDRAQDATPAHSAHARHSRHAPEKIPSSWKMPSDQ